MKNDTRDLGVLLEVAPLHWKKTQLRKKELQLILSSFGNSNSYFNSKYSQINDTAERQTIIIVFRHFSTALKISLFITGRTEFVIFIK